MHRFTVNSTVLAMLLAALLYAPAAFAQVGVRAGLSSATISFSPASGSPELPQIERQPGLAGGLFLMLPGSRAGGWQVEVLVVQKGARNLLRFDDAMRLTYVEIPALIHLDVVQRGRSAIYLVAGPSVAFNVQASYEDEGVKENIRDDIRKFDASLHLGGGIEHGPLVIEARYAWGLRRVFEDGDLDGAFKNRAFLVTAGVRLGR